MKATGLTPAAAANRINQRRHHYRRPSSTTKKTTMMMAVVCCCFFFLIFYSFPPLTSTFNLPFDLAMPDLHQIYKPLIDYNTHGAFKFLRCMGPDFAHVCSKPILDCLHHTHPIHCIEHLECCENNKATHQCINHLKAASIYDKLFHVPIVKDDD